MVALLAGAVVAGGVLLAEDNSADRRESRGDILENTRFARQLATEFPSDPKPLAGLNLKGASLTGLNLTCADLTRAVLVGADLSGADLTGADLTDANLKGANLSYADLSYAQLVAAELDQAVLSRAILTGADLSSASLVEANLFRAKISGVFMGRGELRPDGVKDSATKTDCPAPARRSDDLLLTFTDAADLTGVDLRCASWDPENPPKWPVESEKHRNLVSGAC